MADFVLENHAFFWMTQVIASRDRQLTVELKNHDLRVPEWRALATLHARQSLSMSELAELASIDRSTLTRTVDRLQQAGWMARVSDTDDMRVTRLTVTPDGEALFARLWPMVERLNNAAAASLPEPAMGMLRWTLERMKSNLDADLAAQQNRAG